VARRIEVDIVGDASSLQRTFQQTVAGTQRFEREMTGSFKRINTGLKSIVLGAGAYVGITGLATAFDTVVKAGIDAQVSQKALAAQLKASGESFKQNQQAIEKSGLSLARYGFTVEDSQHALTILDRATGSVTRAMQVQGVAANIAAATGRPLAQVSLILGKAYDGQTASLKRLGIQIPKHVSGMQAIYIAARKYAGQGLANTTIEKQFGVALHNTEVIIGTALLPTVNRYLGKLTDWLDKLNRSGRLQRDVNTAVKDATSAFEGAKAVLGPLITAFKDLTRAVGGTKHMVELLLGAFLAFKTAKLITAIATVASSVTGVGTAAATATGEVGGLRGALLGLGEMNPIAIPITLAVVATETGHGDPLKLGRVWHSITHGDIVGALTGRSGLLYHLFAGSGAPSGPAAREAAYTLSHTGRVTNPLKYLQNFFSGIVKQITPAAGRVPATAGIRQNTAWNQLQNELARDPNNIGLLRQRVAYDKSALVFLDKLRAQHRITLKDYNTKYRNYWNDINSTLSTITSTTAKATKAANAPWQVPIGLQIAQARAGAFGTTAEQNNVLRRIKESALKALKSGRYMGQSLVDLYNTIAGINQQLAQGANQYVIKYQRGLRGTQPAYAVGGGHVTINGGVHLHGVHDVAAMENELEARAKRRPVTRRGR